MIPGELKPVLAALALPPAAPLLLALLGLLLATRRRAAGLFLAFLGLAVLWLLSCNAVAVWLARTALPQVAAVQPADLRPVQAIVILGGGVVPAAPEYGTAQPGMHALGRIRYGAWLARRTGKPLAYAGGIGWGGRGDHEPEAAVARRVLQEDYGLALRWVDDRSADTRQNAQFLAGILLPQGVRRIALVSDAWHLPRAAAHFRAAGFEVLPAPTGFVARTSRDLLEWLPSAGALADSRGVLREWLAARAGS